MGAVSVGRFVSAALDPILVPEGFAAGQYGEGGDDRPGRAQVIFCAGHDDFSDRHPWMPQANDQERDVGACIDLVLDVDAAGTLESVHLEGHSLEKTLQLIGLIDESRRATDVLGQTMTEALPVVAPLLKSLLATPPPRVPSN